MRKNILLKILFLLIISLSFGASCTKDDPPPPTPPPPPPIEGIDIQIEFQGLPEDMKFYIDVLTLLDKDKQVLASFRNEYKYPLGIYHVPYSYWDKVLNQKVYILIAGVRMYDSQFYQSSTIRRAIDPLLPLPAINKIVVVLEPDLLIPQEEIDP